MFKQFINALLISTTLSFSAYAAEVQDPQKLIQNATESMLQALKDHKQALDEDETKIYPLVTEIIMPHFDFEKMSKLALGKNWRNASSSQRERFIEEFRLLLVRTYSTALLEYTDEKIDFLPFTDDVSEKKVKVDMEIVQQGGPTIPMTLSLYLNDEEHWKVYDVKIDGISLVTNYRSSFANEIRSDGMDKLIERLASRNEKVKA
jgi:phospholipid transport system substrate-binding protein